MEDEEDNLSTVNNSVLPQVEDSITEGKLLGIEKNPNMAANLDDSKLDSVETPVVLKAEEPSAKEEITTEEPKLDDFGPEPSMDAKGDDDDEAAAEEIPTVDTKIETEVEAAMGGEEHAAELSDTHPVDVYSPIAADIETGDSVQEMKPLPAVEAEASKDDGGALDELKESQLAGAESSIVLNHDEVGDRAVEKETPADPQMVGEEETEAEPQLEEEETEAEPQMEEEETPVDPQMEEEEIQADPQMEEEEETPADPQIEEGEEETPADPKMEEEEAESDEEEVGKGSGDEIEDSQLVGAEDEEDETMVAEEETPSLDTEMETETDAAESAKVGGGKRKRGRNSKGTAKAPATRKKTMEEDVCFICFDGGELVLCDRRGCPKAYHPSCVNRDEAFFRAKGRWNCGWHQCSICEKNAHYMCYTCTYSLCKGCIKDAVILCVRGNKGFCEACMKTVMLIENEEQGNKEAQVDFNDRSSWEYLFKDYWLELKEKLSLSSTEITQAKNPHKGSDPTAGKQGSPDEPFDVNEDGGSASENSSESLEERKPKKIRGKKLSKSLPKEQNITSETLSKGTSMSINTEWASSELLEFVMHMRNGDKTISSQFDVQAMLLEYIKRNKLRDPRRKSQIICDARLQNLFGKARVGHFEMLKLLESHFLIKEDSQIDDIQGSVVDTDVNLLDGDANADLAKGGKDKKRKTRKKGGGPQSNIDDYAAIDTHNINLIYLRRKLMEDLLEDTENFNEKVVGTFVRIRIPGSNQKQDIYRLVQVVGTSTAATPYKVSKRTTDIMLEILNLDKNEVVSIDSISNQEFTEDECKRLRQSIKCGLINRLTVGDILEKAMEIQAARVNDWMESEIVRLSHLRDRASEKGRRKELRECVEKLQLLKTPEERRRRLEEITEIHADPKMDPGYESEDNGSEMEEDSKREVYTRPRGSAFSRRPREPLSPGRGSDLSPKDSWSGNRKNPGKNWELNKSLSNKSLPVKVEDATPNFERLNDNSWNQRRDKEAQRDNTIETFGFNTHSTVSSEPSPANFPTPVVPTAAKIGETDKMWHYKDPSGKAQGPFSMVQLRKWSKNGYFPADLKIWRNGKESDLILLTDALAGSFPADTTPAAGGERNLKSNGTLSNMQDGGERILKSQLDHRSTPSVEVPKVSVDSLGPDYNSMDNSVNLPSPTPKQSSAGWTGGTLQSPTPDSSQLLRSSSSIKPGAASKEYNVTPSLGALAPSSLLNSGGQSIGVSEIAPASSHYGFSAGPSSQLTAGGESHGAQTYSHPVPAPETAANMVQSVNSQNPAFGTQGWVSSAPPQNLVPNSSVHVPGQPPAYAHWGGVPSEPWRPQIQGNQMNMQPQLPPNVPWGMGVAENNPSVQNLRPDNPNAGWVAMSGNPNMGWVGPVPGNTNMNWGPAVPTGNVNPGWGTQPGNQGFVSGNLNPGWVAPPNNQPWVASTGPVPGNANPGWAPPNSVPNVQAGNANQGWVAGTGNAGGNNNVQGPAPGNPNQGWGSPATNRGSRGSEPHHHGDRFSGRRDNRPWNRQSSFGSGGSGGSSRSSPRGPPKVCSYYENGNCKKGSSCDFMHN